MYERLLNKSVIPDETAIREHLGEESYNLLADFENRLQGGYQLSRELKFPFGSSYGWGYKYSHKFGHLCYAFFEKNAFTVRVAQLEN